MLYEPDLNDPDFYDEGVWITCDKCSNRYDEKEYSSSTCVECEDKETNLVREGKK